MCFHFTGRRTRTQVGVANANPVAEMPVAVRRALSHPATVKANAPRPPQPQPPSGTATRLRQPSTAQTKGRRLVSRPVDPYAPVQSSLPRTRRSNRRATTQARRMAGPPQLSAVVAAGRAPEAAAGPPPSARFEARGSSLGENSASGTGRYFRVRLTTPTGHVNYNRDDMQAKLAAQPAHKVAAARAQASARHGSSRNRKVRACVCVRESRLAVVLPPSHMQCTVHRPARLVAAE